MVSNSQVKPIRKPTSFSTAPVLVDAASMTVEVRNQMGSGLGAGRVLGRGERVVSQVLPDLILPVEKVFED
jgi:hypothetical protein